ncbi:methanethiol oxidase [Thauera phenolivorans]|uniref:selenium-binding protein SBP56-related protein n=1 Tax=Thauera phenolivorans TaxID=1792543 RepID=UPI00083B29FE|nr:selenium-binding protein SBP56-related protein [Thauera phenolivorans]
MRMPRGRTMMVALMLPSMLVAQAASADETCNSPYLSTLIEGQEDYVHVGTLGVKGLGDESDKLVTVDVNPRSKSYGTVVHTLSVGGRGEAHHGGFTDDRRYLWAGRLDDNRIFVFDIGGDPAKPRLVRTISDFAEKTGYVGPHTFYALPGRMLVQGLSNTQDHGGRTGMAVYNNKGEFVARYDMPTGEHDGVAADGYGYDIGINPQKNALLTSSFTGWNNYMMDFGKLVQDGEAMKRFGNTMVMWNLKAMKPEKVMSVPGSPLEIRWSLKPDDNWALTATALTSKLVLVKQDEAGEWLTKAVADIGDPAKIPLPVDISISADAKGLWVNTFMDGKTRYFDLSNPEAPVQTYEKVIGKQVNMVSQSWDGKRVYFTSSLLGNWDKRGGDDEQFLKLYHWDGKALTEQFALDFYALELGRAHHMKFSAAPGRRAVQNDDRSPLLARR